jgi:hypothetical protein
MATTVKTISQQITRKSGSSSSSGGSSSSSKYAAARQTVAKATEQLFGKTEPELQPELIRVESVASGAGGVVSAALGQPAPASYRDSVLQALGVSTSAEARQKLESLGLSESSTNAQIQAALEKKKSVVESPNLLASAALGGVLAGVSSFEKMSLQPQEIAETFLKLPTQIPTNILQGVSYMSGVVSQVPNVQDVAVEGAKQMQRVTANIPQGISVLGEISGVPTVFRGISPTIDLFADIPIQAADLGGGLAQTAGNISAGIKDTIDSVADAGKTGMNLGGLILIGAAIYLLSERKK